MTQIVDWAAALLKGNIVTSRIYEPLTADNAAVVLVDHQVGLTTGVCDFSTGASAYGK